MVARGQLRTQLLPPSAGLHVGGTALAVVPMLVSKFWEPWHACVHMKGGNRHPYFASGLVFPSLHTPKINTGRFQFS